MDNTSNITFTNGTTITIDTSTIYTGYATTTGTTTTNTTGGTITIGGVGVGSSWPNTNYYTPPLDWHDGYGVFPSNPRLLVPQKKGADVLVDELKSSIFAELDKCIESIEGKKEVEHGYDELLAKAQMMQEMLDMASEMIKERLEKLRKRTDDLFSE